MIRSALPRVAAPWSPWITSAMSASETCQGLVRLWQGCGAPQNQNQQQRGMVAGQPIADTHPEVLGAGELLPGIAASEFADRRRRLAKLLPPGVVAVIPAAATVFVTGVIPYPYRQDADFLYLTGITQQQAFMMLETPPLDATESDPKMTLFVPAPNAERERWDGVPLRASVAEEVFGADEVHTTHEMPAVMKGVLQSAQAVFYNPEAHAGRFCKEVPALKEAIATGKARQLKPLMHKLRWRKSQAEVQLMRESARISALAITRCMQLSSVPRKEQHLAATFEYECRMAGAQRLAYPSVVAGGPDACTIHYIRNDKMLEDGQMVLMDAGCELWGYSSDITRTWPIGGKYSGPQREVYEAVLNVHRQCVNACRTGATLRQIHNLSVRLISQAIADLGILGSGVDAAAVMAGSYRPLYCHSVGHWLGLDTHDTHTVAHDLELKPGVTMTIEPGLYIPNDPDKFGKYAGIGVRIEDDIVVRADGQPPEVLSALVPTDPDEIEALVSGGEPIIPRQHP